MNTNVPFELVVPEVAPLVLDDWQERSVQYGLARRRWGLGAEMGMGKTPPGLEWMHRTNPSSCIIIVTKRAILGWLRMMRDWYPQWMSKFVIILRRDTAERQAKWAAKPDFVITTWNWWQRDQKYIARHNYQMCIVDEAHKFIRNRKTKTFPLIKAIACLDLLVITGSPASRGPEHFWTYLNLINPRLFSSYWKFVNTWCIVIDGPFGKEICGVKNIDTFHSILRNHFLLIRKGDIGAVKKRRQFLDCELTDLQKKAYHQIQEDMVLRTPSGLILCSNPMVAALRLRQILCLPAMLNPELGLGGALESILEELEDMTVDEQHCVIFTPFRKALPHIEQAIIQRKLRPAAHLFMGGLEVEELGEKLDAWKRSKGIAACVIKYAESFDMETTDKAFMLGYEWDPYENYQAEDRVDRRNNTNNLIRIIYARCVGTYDERVMENLVMKATNLNAIYGDQLKLSRLLGLKSKPESESESVNDSQTVEE